MMTAEEIRRFRSSGAWKRIRRVILAEESNCGICGKPVDKDMPARLPGSPEVDHRIPLERGGHPTERSNLMLTHKLCNQKKSNRMMTDGELLNLQKTINKERYRGPEENWSDILGG